jgi:diaminopimelate epimerase
VVHHRQDLTVDLTRLRFWKMTGSGNDFVFLDARLELPAQLYEPPAISALCDRRRAIGADGVVFLEQDARNAYGIRYFNRDGSLAEFCGNASLCSVTLAAQLGMVSPSQRFSFRTSSGAIPGCLTSTGPEVGMPDVLESNPAFEVALAPGEKRIGYARVGVPHVVVFCADIDTVDVATRGPELRYHASLPAGANVNFVARRGAEWTYRTYERGVEEETLACGSGSVATAAMLTAWKDVTGPVRLITRSGAALLVSFPNGSAALAGEGRLVFEGRLRDFSSAS